MTTLETTMRDVPLYRLAHSRTGDKGNVSNISVIAWRPDLYPILVAQLTVERIARQFAHRHPVRIDIYPLPSLHALNIVLDGVLEGGVNDALNLDTHGKALSFHLLDLPLRIPAGLADTLPDLTPGAG